MPHHAFALHATRPAPGASGAPDAEDDGAAAFLDHLRGVAMRCRSKPRADLFEACALLQATPSAARTASSEALMRCLNEALGRRARLHAAGVAERSFDEAWLVQLGRACARQDNASAAFLLGSRIPHQHRRLIRFLVQRAWDASAQG